MPLPATIFTPEFIQLGHVELQPLLNGLRDPLCSHLLLLIVTQGDFKTGHLVTSYARLIELCTPPQPERGRRLAGPTLKEMRRALEWLEGARLIKRDKAENAAQGMLKLSVRRREAVKPKRTSVRKEGRV